MKTWTVGEKSKAICDDCGKLVSTTFGIHTLPTQTDRIIVNDVMAATCDECGTVVAIPAISEATVRQALAAHVASQETAPGR